MESFIISHKIYFIVFITVIGLCIGSFLNVVALRLLSKDDFVKGRSKCPKCNNTLNWYDNIPVISFILLKARCRNCKEPISFQYPAVELVTAFLFLALFLSFGLTLKTILLFYLVSNLIVITVTDIREKYIFDINSLPIIPVGLAYNFFDIGHNSLSAVKFFSLNIPDVFVSALIGAVAGALFFEIFSRIGLLLAGEYAFGTGDSILAAGLGAWFGWKLLVAVLIISFLSQMFVGVPVLLVNMIKDKDYKSITAMGMLLFSLILAYTGKFLTSINLPIISIIVILISFILSGIAIFIILKQARERESYTFLPFGPALVLGGFMVMFFGKSILGYFI